MSRCLRNRTLLALVSGEGTAYHRTHLMSCQACDTRYQRLVRNLNVIEQVLLTTAPLEAVPDNHPRLVVRWVFAATLTAILFLSWIGFWRSSDLTTPSSATTAQREEIYQFLETAVAPALFATTETGQQALPTSVSSADYLQAALGSEWPCGYHASVLAPECNTFPFSTFE